ncbi:MAG: hypothetical protein H7Y04_00995 [Verrucomicrobia bacterium]|nr:hypothetical protein [Cytophagales bacterium]
MFQTTINHTNFLFTHQLRYFLLMLVCCMCVNNVFAQSFKVNSENTADFPKDVNTFMEASKNPNAIKAGKDFEGVWGNLSESQQKQIIAIAKKMAAKKFKAVPFFVQFFSGLASGVSKLSMASGEIDKLLMVTEKVIDKNDARLTTAFFEAGSLFLDRRALFAARGNRLYALEGSFSFDWKEGDTAPAVIDTVVAYDANGRPIEPTTSTQPEIAGPVLVFKDINLVFASNPDSVQLQKTSGSFMFKDRIFVGKSGKFDWSNLGKPEVYADFQEYSFNTKAARLHAENVTFHYDSVLVKPANGVFDFEAKSHKGIKDAVFPRFTSQDNDVSLKNIGQNLVYQGGFSLSGSNKFTSSNALNKFSTLSYLEKDSLKFKLSSRIFEFKDSLITSPSTAIFIYNYKNAMDRRDSVIYHPSVVLKYTKNSKILQLNRQNNGSRNVPYANYHHKVDMRVDVLKWLMDSTKIEMYMIRGRDSLPALFVSIFYFNER